MKIIRWRDIPGYPGYQINTSGVIKCGNKEVSVTLSEEGYVFVSILNKDFESKIVTVHRLIYTAFVGSIRSDECIHHKDGNKSNNDISNLIKMKRKDHNKLHYMSARNKYSDLPNKPINFNHKRNVVTSYNAPSYIFMSDSITESRAFYKLRGASVSVLISFLAKEQSGNTDLIFSYTEAKKKYGISKSRFARAIDGLVCYGFIDIVEYGDAMAKAPTIYALSDRYLKFGTNDFIKVERKKRDYVLGFATSKYSINRNDK